MASNRPRRSNRLARFEQIEPRLMMSGQPACDFHLDYFVENQRHEETQTTLFDAHALSGMDQVFADYGFSGAGQTVAVIDSGIAYDHTALGGGLGSGYRVVGGYDFAEGDADPYDDGPYGSHGTHVAGIVGSDNLGAAGVASSVDLVGLRVFDDQGRGYFQWVEQALQWVHTHRNSFENPITTVNLSLGTSYNGSQVPYWGMLEDEFAQLESDGIFIAVAAGNSFTTYNSPGLSYPAVSPHVVPVSSIDNDGTLSYFSQRHQRAIAAPGRSILSTVPDYVGNFDGRDNDYARYSGTSMAAPYVAGASVIVRQAMEFAGLQGIDQDAIYDLMRNTADTFYDRATGASYRQLNLDAAIDAIMPADDYGSTVAEAYAAGPLADGSTLAGSITQLDDLDYFTFTASASGTMTLTSAVTHEMAAEWQLLGASASRQSADELVFDVVAGETYTVGLGTGAGIGHYQIDVGFEGGIDWGAIAQQTFSDNRVPAGGQAYSFTATRDGIVTVEAIFDHFAGDVDIQLYNGQQQLLGGSYGVSSTERIDAVVSAGERLTLYAYAEGGYADNANVDFRITNLVSHQGDTLSVTGAETDNQFRFAAGAVHELTVNGVDYRFAAGSVSDVRIEGLQQEDSLQLIGTAADETVRFSPGEVAFSSDTLRLTATGVEHITAVAGGGSDEAFLLGSAGNDEFTARPDIVGMSGAGFSHRAHGFAYAHATGNGGRDVASFRDTVGDDLLVVEAASARLTGGGLVRQADGFRTVYAIAGNGGNDVARLYGSAGNDHFQAAANWARMRSGDRLARAIGFDTVVGIAGQGGFDRADLYDTAGDDVLSLRPGWVHFSGVGMSNYAEGFSLVEGHSEAGGDDRAIFRDSTAADTLLAEPFFVRMFGEGFDNRARGFGRTDAYSQAGGNDTARFFDSAGDDVFAARYCFAQMSGRGFDHRAEGFRYAHGFSLEGGDDVARLYGSPSDDLLTISPEVARLYGPNSFARALGFRQVDAMGIGGGTDRVEFYDSDGDDRLELADGCCTFFSSGFLARARFFEQYWAESDSGGHDEVLVSDTASADHVHASAMAFHMASEAFRAELAGFDYVRATSRHGGNDTAQVDSIDYVLELIGDWE
jgi:subtilisin family serine protease